LNRDSLQFSLESTTLHYAQPSESGSRDRQTDRQVYLTSEKNQISGGGE